MWARRKDDKPQCDESAASSKTTKIKRTHKIIIASGASGWGETAGERRKPAGTGPLRTQPMKNNEGTHEASFAPLKE